jgi:hypothetical protein
VLSSQQRQLSQKPQHSLGTGHVNKGTVAVEGAKNQADHHLVTIGKGKHIGGSKNWGVPQKMDA